MNAVTVYSDLLDNSENESLNKISSNLKNLDIMRKAEMSSVTYSSPDTAISKYIQQYIKLPSHKEVSYDTSICFQIEQEWEGYVQEINDDNSTFTALLLDITDNQKYPTEEADFKQEDINKFDLHFLRSGAVFRWIIGYERSTSGIKRSVSKLVFRRMPKWNKEALKRADKKAQQFKDEIIWE